MMKMGKRILAMLLAVVMLVGVMAAMSISFAANTSTLQILQGIWKGTYDGHLNGEPVKRIIEIELFPKEDGSIEGIAYIDNETNGKYYFTGSFNYSTGEISFIGKEWINNPSNFGFSRFSGTFESNIMTGIIDGNSERVFELKKTADKCNTEKIDLKQVIGVWVGEYDGHLKGHVVRRSITLDISGIDTKGNVKGKAYVTPSEKEDEYYGVYCTYWFSGFINTITKTITIQGYELIEITANNNEIDSWDFVHLSGVIDTQKGLIIGESDEGIWSMRTKGQAVRSFSLSERELNLYAGDTKELTTSLSHYDIKITWKSDNKNIAKVNSRGVVSALKPGKCKITAMADGVSVSCFVTVIGYRIKLNKSSLSIYEGDAKKLKATMVDINNKIAWSTSNNKIATVNSKGTVTAIEAGTCVIKAKAGKYSVSCTVKVVKPFIKLSQSSVNLYEGQTGKLTASLNGLAGDIAWKSSNKEIAVIKDGKITAKKPGTCRIAAITTKTVAGQTKAYKTVCGVTVKKPTLKLSAEELKMYPGMQSKLFATAKGKSSKVKWESLTPLYASVDQTGLVTAIARGTCYIQASANGVTKNCKINIRDPYITLKESTLTLYVTKVGDLVESKKLNISEIFGPSKKVKWKSSNQNVATVNSGVVTAVKAGTCAITVSTKEATSKKCTVTVKYAPEYTITYNLDGGVNSPKNPKTYTPITPTFTLKEPTKSGYKFKGWIDANGKPCAEIKKGTKGNITITAKWQPNIIAPVDLTMGQWYAIAYPGHWKPEEFQFYATDWNCYANGNWNYDAGQNVYAIADGEIVYSSTATGSIRIRHTTPLYLKNGNTIHENSWFSWYGHMHNIKRNGYVKQGEVIGTIGNASADNYHLHFSVYAAYEPYGYPAYGISPYWVQGDLSNPALYADDIYGTREGIYRMENGDLPAGYEIYNGKNVYDAILDDSRMPS